MKKIISICLVTILLISLPNIAIADSSTKIKASLTSQMKLTAKQWYSTADKRAELTVFVAMDTFLSFQNFDATDELVEFLQNSTWVGLSKNQRQLMVAGYYGSTNLLFMVYTPSNGQIEYTEMKMTSDSPMPDTMIELMVAQVLSDQSNKYQQNDKSDVMAVVASFFD